MKKIILSIIIFLTITLTFTNKSAAISSLGGYEIQKYHTEIIVNENNSLDITEYLTVYFYTSRHGIYRKIPFMNNIKRNNGSTSKKLARISNINVSEEYKTYSENGNKVIKIGDANKEITGLHEYTIKYTYALGKDTLKKADELYYNIIGTEWDATIKNASFRIVMPKSFDKSLLGFSSGPKGSTNSSNIRYNIDGNEINGYTVNELKEQEALTIRLTLPEGYFVREITDIDIYAIGAICISILCTILGYILWVKFGKDNPVVDTVEFYPPEGLNSAEIGFLYYGEVKTESIISLLVYLADKGYLKIEETTEQGALSNIRDFKITKLKEYDGYNESERIFFNGLFEKGNGVNPFKVRKVMKEAKQNGQSIKYSEAVEIVKKQIDYNSATSEDLDNKFYTTVEKVKRTINSKQNTYKIFEKSSIINKIWILLMIIIIAGLCTVKPLLEYSNISSLMILLLPATGLWVLLKGTNYSESTINILSVIIIMVLFFIYPWTKYILPVIAYNNMYLVMHIVGIVCIGILVKLYNIMQKRTTYGNEMLGKINGFKRFLETAEKTRLESLVEQNPQYFYNILPYTYALGVSDKWMRKFESIALQPPNWYTTYNGFSVRSFENFMNSTMIYASTVMTSSPSSSSGGGSSGGGSGGGGGGSW